jgi:hypothetical protein
MPHRFVFLVAMLAVAGNAAAVAGGPYDGTYHGTLTADGMNTVSCAKSAPVQMSITDGKLEYHHFSNATITAPVAADGSFSGSAQNMYTAKGQHTPVIQTLDGKISGNAINAETKVGNRCTYTLALKKF